MIILTPMKEEFDLAVKKFGSEHKIVHIGVGPRNALKSLIGLGLPRCTDNLMLFGYAGSNILPKGVEVFVTESYLHQYSGADYSDPPCKLMRPKIENAPRFGVPCYSSSDFVTATKIDEPAIFDMELAFLTALYPMITAWRVVSDALDLKEFYETVKEKK